MFTIAYATDNGYAQHVAVSLYSLYKSTQKPNELQVFILDNNLSEDHRQKLKETAGWFGRELHFIDISDIALRLPAGTDTANLSISTYCRLFVAQLLPSDIDLLLYLDCDTYINDDITDIVNFLPSSAEWYVAGVEDTMYPSMKEGIGLKRTDLYLNAGILLINLKRWRDENIVSRFIQFIEKYHGAVPHLDQGVINGVFREGKVRLPLRYNVQAPIFAIHGYRDLVNYYSLPAFYDARSVDEAIHNPAIVHFTSFFLERPWFRFCLHPLKHLYRHTLRHTPYAQSQLQVNKSGLVNILKDLCFKYFQPLYLWIR